MFGLGHRAHRRAVVDTVVGGQTDIRGHIVGSRQAVLRVDGHLVGDLETDGEAVVGEGGAVEGDIRARHAVIGGSVTGNVIVAGMLELLPTARLRGELQAGTLVVAAGAHLQGPCAVVPAEESPGPVPAPEVAMRAPHRSAPPANGRASQPAATREVAD